MVNLESLGVPTVLIATPPFENGAKLHARVFGLPEYKATQARLDELLTEVQSTGVQLKGLAPLLIDFPSELHGAEVALCWLEGDRKLGWYHRLDLGFAGRRPLPMPMPMPTS